MAGRTLDRGADTRLARSDYRPGWRVKAVNRTSANHKVRTYELLRNSAREGEVRAVFTGRDDQAKLPSALIWRSYDRIDGIERGCMPFI
jgi:hypothetical protein